MRHSNGSRAASATALFIGAMLATSVSSAQVMRLEPTPAQAADSPPAQPAAPSPAGVVAPPAKTSVSIPEGTEVRVRLEEQLSSAHAVAGDTFSISTDEEIHLSDGTVIPAGYRGRGEVAGAHRREMLGKAGELSIRLDYIRIGDTRVRLRANKASDGKSNVTTTVVLSLLVTPLFLLMHGHEMVFPKGAPITAFVDADTVVPLPIAPPPAVE